MNRSAIWLGSRAIGLTLMTALVAGACSSDPAPPEQLILLTHDSFAVPEEVLDEFTAMSGIEVEILRGGDAGTMVNQAILTKDNPIADVLFGVDNTFASRAIDEGIFSSHEAIGLDQVPEAFLVDSEHRITPIDFGDVCLNYDRTEIPDESAPAGLSELVDDQYHGKIVVQDPATSSPGLAFLLATVAAFPEGADYDWQDYWTDLVANDVAVTSGWEEAYYGSFSGGAGEGTRPLVVSYASSPPAEIIFAEEPLTDTTTAAMTEGCFRQIEFAGVLSGSGHEDAAGMLIDFMLTQSFQESLPLNMFVFPVLSTAQLPPEFVQYTSVPDNPLTMTIEEIGAGRDDWIRAWTELVR
ncbi:MAG: thiamine ABC transporter substrate-binding protein [Acidimicrobiia bacterium]